MTEYACSVCEYISSKKDNIIRHVNKKKSCGPGIKEIIEIPVIIKCDFCSKTFLTKQNLHIHHKLYCKEKDNIKDAKIKELEEKLKYRSIPIKNNNEFNNYIYLIKIYPYEDNIYKIGRTGDIQTRLAVYKRYKIVFITSCEDDVNCEKDLIELYKFKTIQCKEMGNEYFYGEYQQMINIIQLYFTPL